CALGKTLQRFLFPRGPCLRARSSSRSLYALYPLQFPRPTVPIYSYQFLQFFLDSQTDFLHLLTPIGHSWDDVQPFGLSGPAQRSVPVPAGIGKNRNKGDGMIRQQIRVALLAGSLVAATALTARADDPHQPAPAAPAANPCAPQFRTVCVKEWVPETY